jgi:hypothetical protein
VVTVAVGFAPAAASDLTGSGGEADGEDSGALSAAVLSGSGDVDTIDSGSAGAEVAAVSAGAATACGSAAFGLTAGAGGSARSTASTGFVGSLGCMKVVSGVARNDVLLANCSCAARSRAAAPSPNTRIDMDRTIAANRKRKPGSIYGKFRPDRVSAKAFEQKGTR